MPKVFLTLKLKLRPPTGRKAKVLVEVQRLYADAVAMTLALAKENLVSLTATPPEERKKLAYQNAFPMPAEAGEGLHSSLRNAARLAVLAAVESYLSLSEQAKEGEEPAWPGEAQNDWPDFERVLDDLTQQLESGPVVECVMAGRKYGSTKRELNLAVELSKASFLAKEQRRGLGDILWFPAMAAPFRPNYGGLLNDGTNWFAMVYVLAPEHPMAKTIKGDGTLFDLENRPWNGRSKCALVLPLEIDRHDWQHKRFLSAFLAGEATVQTAQLYRERSGDWSFAVQSAWKREIGKVDHWLGLAFEGAWPLLSTAEGRTVQLAGAELQDVAKLDVLLRAALQRKGQDISYHRLHGTTSKQVVHLWANLILAIARTNESGVAITGAGRPILGVPRAKLNQVLGYKAVLAGAPVRLVSSKDAAWWCPNCGAEIEKPEKKPWPLEQECICGRVTSAGSRIAWHLAKRAEDKYVGK